MRIWGNTFHDVLMGISLAPVYDGPVYAIRNVVYRTGAGNNSYTGSPFKFNSGYDLSGPMYLFHNTADAALTDPRSNGLYIKAPGSWEMIYARNNVWAGTDYALDDYNTGQPLDLDYDDLWNDGANDLVRWDDTRYATLADFTAATGHESHGLSVEPGFADAANGEYTLDPSSALIDAGLVIPGINDQYVGAGPDIGAYEYAGYGFSLDVSPPSQGIDPGGVAVYHIEVQPVGGFSDTVALVTASPSPSLTLALAPAGVAPPGLATLTVTDTHSATLLPGLRYAVPITGAGGGITQTVSAGLLVGGARLYLPLILKERLAMPASGVGSAPVGQTDAPFAIAYGGKDYDVPVTVQQAGDGGYVVLGYTIGDAPNFTYWVLKLDADGGIAWQKAFGGYQSSYRADAIQQTDDGGLIVAGRALAYLGAGGADLWVLKLDAGGCVVWQKVYGGVQDDSAATIRQTEDGGYVVAGETWSFGAGWRDAWVLKLDAEGAVIWEKTYGEMYQDGASAILPTADGGYVVAGHSAPGASSSQKAWVFKLDASGNVAWQKTYGGVPDYDVWDLQQAGDGGYVMAGATQDGGAGGDDAWVLKLSAGGEIVWQKTCGGGEHDSAFAIQPTDDGGYIAAGSTGSFGAGYDDFWLLKFDSGGDVTWQRTYGGGSYDEANAVQQADDGGYVVVGMAESFTSGQSDVWMLKLDSSGSLCSGCALGGTSAGKPVDGVAEASDGAATSSDSSAIVADGYARVYDADLSPQPLCACSLSIQKYAEPAIKIAYHSAITYTVVLANNTYLDKPNAVLTDTLPAQVNFARWVEQPAGAKVVEDRLTWSGTVTAGAAIHFTFVVSHVGGYQDVVVNTAQYSHATGAGSDDATFTVEGRYALYLPLVLEEHLIALPFATVYKGAGYSDAYALQLTRDGGYIIAGETWFSNDVNDAWLAKLKVDGSVAWQKAYGGAAMDSIRAIVQMDDGNYMAAGVSKSFGGGDRDAWLLKLDSSGNIVWQWTFGGTGEDFAYAIQKTSDGGCVVAGGTNSSDALWYDAWVLKLNGDGSVAWQKTYGGGSHDEARAIQQTGDGGYIVAAMTNSFGGGQSDPWVFKLNGDGSMAWQRAYGTQYSDEAYAIQQTLDGGYVLVAQTGGSCGDGGRFWVLKLDAAGNVTWQKSYGGDGWDRPYTIQQTGDGGYMVGGTTSSFGMAGGDAWVLKLNEDGDVIWQKAFGGGDDGYEDSARAIQQTDDGGYLVAGGSGTFGGAWVLRLNADGSFCDGCFLGQSTDAAPIVCSIPAIVTAAEAADSDLTAADSDATIGDIDSGPEPVCVCTPPVCTRR